MRHALPRGLMGTCTHSDSSQGCKVQANMSAAGLGENIPVSTGEAPEGHPVLQWVKCWARGKGLSQSLTQFPVWVCCASLLDSQKKNLDWRLEIFPLSQCKHSVLSISLSKCHLPLRDFRLSAKPTVIKDTAVLTSRQTNTPTVQN